LRNFTKQHLILRKFYINNASSVGNENANFQLNLFTLTIVTAAFVRSPENVNCPVLINPDSVHGLLENSAINF